MMVFLFTCLFASAAEEVSEVSMPEVTYREYVYPDKIADALHFVEPFDKKWKDRWHAVKTDKFQGRWEVQARKEEMLKGDTGLVLLDEAAHHAIATNFKPLEKPTSFVIQYEVQTQRDHSCGGAYVKVFDGDKSSFSNETPYIIMFGPDKCGQTNKVHFILRHENPVSKVWQEHHFNNAPPMMNDKKTHLYTLRVRTDNSFEILIDGAVKRTGNLLTDMTPPINPPKTIDDPTDVKPATWVDEAKIPDPSVKKPSKEEWDEDEPRMIPDKEAKMPEGWLEDEPEHVEDFDAEEPEDWNEDEDGEWKPPMIENPECTVGCGPWRRPEIPNPKYKGKWSAPMIDNPEYKGEWKPKQIENPNFFIAESPGALPRVSGLGFELWTIENEVLFDNLIVATDEDAVSEFAQRTFFMRKALEDEKYPDVAPPETPDRMTQNLADFLDWSGQNPILLCMVALLPLVLIVCMVRQMWRWSKATSRDQADQNACDECADEITSAEAPTKEGENLGEDTVFKESDVYAGGILDDETDAGGLTTPEDKEAKEAADGDVTTMESALDEKRHDGPTRRVVAERQEE